MYQPKVLALIGFVIVGILIALMFSGTSAPPTASANPSGLSTSTRDLIKQSQATAKFLEQQYIPQKSSGQ